MVALKDISFSYSLKKKGEVKALEKVNTYFEEESFSAIIGASGCGKSTLIKIISGLISPNIGEVFINENPLKKIRKETAVIFQDYGLLPWKTVWANAELPLKINAGRKGEEINRQKVEKLLIEFGLANFAKHYPHELSGGMKQRLAIVRSLVCDPELLLMDEPFSNLDAITKENAQDFLLSIKETRRLTVIMITHSVEDAVYLSDFVYVMNGINPGTITERIKICRDRNFPHKNFREEKSFQDYCYMLRQALLN